MIIRSKNRMMNFNKKSAELLNFAKSQDMIIHKEWVTDGFNCFHAEAKQSALKLGLSVYAECGACVNNNPRIWDSARGKVNEYIYLDAK